MTSIKDYFDHGDWCDRIIECANVDEQGIDAVMASISDEEDCVDVRSLVVTKEQFYFSGLMKHCGEDQRISTVKVNIGALDGSEPIVAL